MSSNCLILLLEFRYQFIDSLSIAFWDYHFLVYCLLQFLTTPIGILISLFIYVWNINFYEIALQSFLDHHRNRQQFESPITFIAAMMSFQLSYFVYLWKLFFRTSLKNSIINNDQSEWWCSSYCLSFPTFISLLLGRLLTTPVRNSFHLIEYVLPVVFLCLLLENHFFRHH